MNMMILTIFVMLISTLLIFINLLISKKKINSREKASPFECGFDPLNSSRLPFSMQFYMISIIFLIFDVEIVIFLPLINAFLFNKYYYCMKTSMFFIMILLMGLYIEWKDGALKWLK